jgi:hypothetical protein
MLPPRQRRKMKVRQTIPNVAILGWIASQMVAKVRLEAGFKPPKRLHARIRVLIRHSPTGRPLDRRIPPILGPALAMPRFMPRIFPVDTIRKNPSTRQRSHAYVSTAELTSKKGRKEGANGD